MVMSLYGGEGISGSSSSSSRGGAPRAATGGLLDKVPGSRALGLGMLPGNNLLDTIHGGCSRLGVAAGVLGNVAKVFTIIASGDELGARVTVLLVLTSLIEKSRSQKTVSKSSGD